jgi:Zn-dependent protease with chaperone function
VEPCYAAACSASAPFVANGGRIVVPYCKCGKFIREGITAYCVNCGFETRPSASTSDRAPNEDPNLGQNLMNDEALRSSGERVALIAGLGLFAVSWLAFDIATDAVPLAVISLGLIIYVLYQQGMTKSSAVVVNSRSFPEVDALAQTAAARLGIWKPNLFVKGSDELNAYAMGLLGSSCVVLHSATIRALRNTPKELQFVIGHEFTHIKCSHVLWQTVAANNPILGRIPILNSVLPLFFRWWSRQAEYTADRGGFVACRDLAASQRALARLVIGPELFDQLNIEEFVEHAHSSDLSMRASELFSSHPLVAKRLLALAEFARSPLGAYVRQADATAGASRN